MKYVFLIIVLIIALQCRNTKNISIEKKSSSDTTNFIAQKDTSDSLQYDIVVLDPGYNTYLAMQPPMNFYPEEYYRSWNLLYVAEWNSRFNSHAKSGLYETYINYDPFTKYGHEFEYKLYYFFRFFEERNHLKLLQRGK